MSWHDTRITPTPQCMRLFIACPECGLDPASIVAAEALDRHAQSPG
jgi:hypothetical protein